MTILYTFDTKCRCCLLLNVVNVLESMAYSEYIDYRIIAENAERRVFDILHSLEWQLHSEKVSLKLFVKTVYLFIKLLKLKL